MSRISRYELVACPYCGAVHHKPCYSSISVTLPLSVTRQSFTCVECCRESERDAFKLLKTVPKNSPEVEAHNYAQTLYVLGMGPEPEPLAKKSYSQRLKELFVRPVKNEWEKYPPLA
jgi:transposase-like protein